MDHERLQRRIRVVVVTTRAAVSSLPPEEGQARAAVGRGLQLLDGVVEGLGDQDEPGRAQLAEARRELESLLDDRG